MQNINFFFSFEFGETLSSNTPYVPFFFLLNNLSTNRYEVLTKIKIWLFYYFS